MVKIKWSITKIHRLRLNLMLLQWSTIPQQYCLSLEHNFCALIKYTIAKVGRLPWRRSQGTLSAKKNFPHEPHDINNRTFRRLASELLFVALEKPTATPSHCACWSAQIEKFFSHSLLIDLTKFWLIQIIDIQLNKFSKFNYTLLFETI